MRKTISVGSRAALGLVLLGLPLLQLAWTRSPAPPSTPEAPLFVPTPPFVRPTRRGPVDQALREAAAHEVQAKQVAHDLDHAPIAWEDVTEDRGAAGPQRLAYDYGGHLRAARRAARRAASLARTPAEACRAAQLLAHLECLAGHHYAEFRQARRLVALAPRDPASWRFLRHALRCNGLRILGMNLAGIRTRRRPNGVRHTPRTIIPLPIERQTPLPDWGRVRSGLPAAKAGARN